MKKWIIPAAICLALAVLGGWGLHEYRRASGAESMLEEICRSAVSETAGDLQALTLHLEKLLVSADPAQRTQLLYEIGQTASDVQRALAFLPLSHNAMAPTLAFVNRLSDYARSLSGAGELSPQDVTQLHQQLTACTRLTDEFILAQQTMQQQTTSLSIWENAFFTGADASRRPPEHLADPDHGMDYPALVYDGAFSSARRSGVPRGLPAGEVTQAEALTAAAAFLGERALKVSAAPDTAGTLPAWGVTVQTADVQLNLEITRQGGRVLWMMPESAGFAALQPADECVAAAADFLAAHGFDPMEMVDYQLYDGLCVINFAPSQNGVRLYPDLVKAQVRMDTAEVVGLEAHGYWMNHASRDLPVPALTREEAQARLHPSLTVQSARLCVIPSGDSERLCYEFLAGTAENDYYVYIDALTGHEAEVRKKIPLEQGSLAA